MAAPNIVNVATITAKTDTLKLTGTSAVQLLENAASSGKVIKVKHLPRAMNLLKTREVTL